MAVATADLKMRAPIAIAVEKHTRKRIALGLLFAASLGFVAAGAYTVVRGYEGRGDVVKQLKAEHIVTPADASIPNVPVVDARTAMSQADIIQHHMLTATGGKTFAQMERTDPNRTVAFQASALRTALLSAVLAWNTANLAMGFGAFVAGVGLILLVSLLLLGKSRKTA